MGFSYKGKKYMICKKIKKQLVPCSDLSKSINSINDINSNKMGINLLQNCSDETSVIDMYTIVNYDSEHRLMNYCPFCGLKI